MKRLVGIVGVCLLGLGVAFAVGRYTAPIKTVERVKVEIQTEVKTEWRDRVVYVQEQTRHVETTTTTKPTGETITVRVEDTRTDVHADHTNEGSATETQVTSSAREKITETRRPDWRLSVVGAWELSKPLSTPDLLGIEVQHRVLGPIWAGPGVYRAGDTTYVGVSIGLEW